jgi:hypothetical protein
MPTYEEQDDIDQEHEDGLHFGDPCPHCWQCELDDHRPESPDPTHD